jgi:hypothetical protein
MIFIVLWARAGELAASKNYISCKVLGICALGWYPFFSHFRSLFLRFTNPNVMHQCADFVSQLCMAEKNQYLKEQKWAT